MVKKLFKDDQSINKGKILKAAVEVFLKKGYQRTTIREISTKSNLSIGSIYFHFKNKEEILKEVTNNIELISTGTTLKKSDKEPPVNFLRNVNFELTEIMVKNYELLLFLINTSRSVTNLNSYLHEQFKNKTQDLTVMFENLVKNGVIRKIDPEKAAIFTLSNCFSMVMLKEGIFKKSLEKSFYKEMHNFILDVLANGFFLKK